MQLKNSPHTDKLSVLTILSLGLIIFGVRLHLIDGLAVPMPYWDDWGIAGFLHNYLTNGVTLNDLITPVNEHRMFFNRLISILVFELNQQQWDPMVMMIINSGIWTLVAILFLSIAKVHQREINILPLVVLILVIWIYPISPVNTLWGVQTHSYMMILLGVSGCWFINQRLFSVAWFIGLNCLFFAGLSMAGGSFAAVAALIIFALLSLSDRKGRKHYTITMIVVSIPALFGLSLIYLQSINSPASNEAFNLTNSILTFSKSMSWPKTPSTWPFLIFLAPIVWLFTTLFKDKHSTSSNSLTRFTLCLYLFVSIIALAIAVARAFNGEGPSRRYLEFLSLACIASLIALLLLQKAKSNFITNTLTIAWVLTFLAALPFQIEVMRYTLEDRANTIPHQIDNMRQFIFAKDQTALLDKPFRHVPFHNGERLANALVDFEASDILPFQLQRPDISFDNDHNNESAFRTNASYLYYAKEIGVDYYGAPMLGSYTDQQKMAATGRFESKAFELNRPYMLLPSLGFLGLHGLSLTLENIDSGEQRTLIPERVGMEHGDEWLENFYRVIPGKYKLIAEDQNTDLWFGFAAPRTVGRISYLSVQLLERSSLFWQIGLLFLVIAQRKSLLTLFTFAKPAND